MQLNIDPKQTWPPLYYPGLLGLSTTSDSTNANAKCVCVCARTAHVRTHTYTSTHALLVTVGCWHKHGANAQMQAQHLCATSEGLLGIR
jgi:hypothetical protein